MGNRHPNCQDFGVTNTTVENSCPSIVSNHPATSSIHATPQHPLAEIAPPRRRLNKSVSDSCFASPRCSQMATPRVGFGVNGGVGGPSSSTFRSPRRPPLKFHNIHGENVRLTKDRRVAGRTDSFCKALAFSERGIAIDEVVFVRFAEVKTNWSGVLRFGVTNSDPVSFGSNLPKYLCPDMTSKEGTWAKAVGDRYCQQGNIMHFFVRENGEMFYGINGSLRGLFLSGINTTLPLFVVVDIYGNTTSVEFVDESEVAPLMKNREQPKGRAAIPPPPSLPPPAPPVAIPAQTPAPLAVPESSPIQQLPDAAAASAQQQLARELERRLNLAQQQEQQQRSLGAGTSATTSASSSTARPTSPRVTHDVAPLTHNRNLPLTPLQFHNIHGSTGSLSTDRTIATRINDEYCGAYFFTSRPIHFYEKVIVQIMSVQPAFNGGLGFGVTNCDPNQLVNFQFPDDADELLNRQEFWAVNKDYEKQPSLHDEMTYYVNEKGELIYQRNNEGSRILMHVDPSLTYYMFFDVYGRAQSIRFAGTADARHRPRSPAPPTLPQNRRRPAHHGQQHQQHNRRTPPMAGPLQAAPITNRQQSEQRQQVRNATGMTVALPPSQPSEVPRSNDRNRQPSSVRNNGTAMAPPVSSSVLLPTIPRHQEQHGRYSVPAPPRPTRPPPPAPPSRTYSVPTAPTGMDGAQGPTLPTQRVSVPNLEGLAQQLGNAGPGAGGTAISRECSVCMDHPINCAVYPCGHMCMCYECGRTTWSRQGVCPICRQNIKDILRLFPSS